MRVDQNQGLFRAGLRAKFIAAFLLQTLVIAVGILLVHQWLVRRAMVRQTVVQARAIARSVESTAAYYVIFRIDADLQSIITDLRKNPSIQYADFLGPNGERLASTLPKVPPEVASQPLAPVDGVQLADGNYLFVIPFYESPTEKTKPKGYFRLLTDDSEADRAAEELRWWNVIISLAAVVVALVMAYFISKWIVRPVMALAGSVQQISQGDLTQRVKAESRDEIGTLANVFNSMSSNLERTIRSVVQSRRPSSSRSSRPSPAVRRRSSSASTSSARSSTRRITRSTS